MSSVTRDPSDFCIAELKEKLREKGLTTSGVKAELIQRLTEADPTGEWLKTRASDEVEESASDNAFGSSDVIQMRREMEIWKREKQLTERELELARQQIELLQEMRRFNLDRSEVEESARASMVQRRPSPVNIPLIADLLSYFDGSGNTFITWERQVQTLKTTHQLTDDMAKLLIGSRLKGNALEWLHSRPEYIEMSVEELLKNLREMFYHTDNVLEMRRRFEARVWKVEENFSEYVHQKIILGNRVPISDAEIIEYIIEGIPDQGLRDLARVQKFTTKGELLAAFNRISLRGRSLPFTPATRPKENRWSPVKTGKQERREVPNTSELRCYNCGDKNHLGVNCPAKSKGPRCFACREFGHRAVDCRKGQDKQVNECTADVVRDNRIYKSVTLLDKQVVALLDTGSDLHIMKAEQYIKLGCPALIGAEISCKGLGFSKISTLGSFYADVRIDNDSFRLLIHVVSDGCLKHNFLIGSELLEEAKLIIDGKNVEVSKRDNKISNSDDIPEILYIDTLDESSNNITNSIVDLQHVKDDNDSDQDTLKETLLETNPYLLSLTRIVTALHSVFEFLAFKKDIQFWNNRNSLEGLSVQSVFFNVFQSLVALLYVLDTETNTVVRISCAVGLCMEVWKINKVIDISINRNSKFLGVSPKLSCHNKGSYVESSTKEYDRLAFRYLSWALYPLVGGYAIYSLMYLEHKGWYSWVLSMLYGLLLTFGFIMMTPQLFINYKLKTVAHLPWRMLTYKFLNTFTDDIFAFVIKMPTLYRIGFFRDDIVFFILLYQRWIYKTDFSRVNKFGFSEEMKTKISNDKKLKAIKDKQKNENISDI